MQDVFGMNVGQGAEQIMHKLSGKSKFFYIKKLKLFYLNYSFFYIKKKIKFLNIKKIKEKMN